MTNVTIRMHGRVKDVTTHLRDFRCMSSLHPDGQRIGANEQICTSWACCSLCRIRAPHPLVVQRYEMEIMKFLMQCVFFTQTSNNIWVATCSDKSCVASYPEKISNFQIRFRRVREKRGCSTICKNKKLRICSNNIP